MLYKLWKLARPSPVLLLLTGFLIILSAVSGLASPWIIRYAVDNLILTGRVHLLWMAAMAIIVFSLLQTGCTFAARYLAEYMGQSSLLDLRNKLYRHLNQLSFSFYDSARTGDIMSRLTVDTNILNNFFGFAAINIVTNSLTILGIIIVLFYWNWQLGLAFLLITPAVVHGINTHAGKVQPAFSRLHRQLGKMTNILEESLTGIGLVKLTGSEAYELEKFEQQNREYLLTTMSVLKISSLWQPYVQFLTTLGIAVAMWSGGRAVIEGSITTGVLIGFITYMGMLVRPIRQTGRMVNVVARSLAAGQRIFEVLNWEPDIKDAPDAYPLPPVKGHVCYENVSFSYDGKNQILEEINLTVEPGQMVALVGPTGAGKTTLIHLIDRFYDPVGGSIKIDGHDLKRVTLESLRRQLGIVLQDTFIFNTTIRENIAYGKPSATNDEVERAARLAQIHDFIISLPMGYDTAVGTRGMTLSGGERQRIAFARVLLTNPRLLILDEATSELDAQTEAALHKAIHEVIKNRTVIIIAHRLWTIQNADKILVLSGGRIVESGSHQELLRLDGNYSRFYDLFLQNKKLPDNFDFGGGSQAK
ncbi:ABC transporter related [Desulfofarcimen acetoxidans DSM 771]|uniref:ABC transporter related n=1 Tax=Desulfofarcimen acetoxidans (strain ATCC 49208 / DSM 771 / KCTC 5769 / VKM B-1644 / 5575) TaxID=485916 RepID=C8W609_DESAS|nr:ABC transporter ATP-binding protein [Desulfofarcimen acetoxidans]ACV61464.1 ABC transporter related [Desulfofarcimen acetoxidans DSM 771]